MQKKEEDGAKKIHGKKYCFVENLNEEITEYNV